MQIRVMTVVASVALIVVMIFAALVTLSHGEQHFTTETEAEEADVKEEKLHPLMPDILRTRGTTSTATSWPSSATSSTYKPYTSPSPFITSTLTELPTKPVQPTELSMTPLHPSELPTTSVQPTEPPPTSARPTELSTTPAEPTELPTTSVEPTELPTTSVEPTELSTTPVQPTELSTTPAEPTELPTPSVEPTELPTTSVQPPELPTTSVEPTELSTTPFQPTQLSTTPVEPTEVLTTSVEPTELPTTSDQPTELSRTSVKPTELPTTPVEPTESMATSTVTSPPASNTTSTVTELTTEPVLPAQPPMTPFPMVCVFGTAMNESQPLPADGVCDYTFYDGLYDTGPFDTLYSPHFSAPVEHVLSHASLHSITEYGLSFAYRNASQVARDLEMPAVLSTIENLWDRAIRHYGFLSIEQYNADGFREIVGVLAKLHTLLQTQRSRVPGKFYFAIGLFLEKNDIRGALDTMRQVRMPDLIIARGHVGYDDRKFGEECKMVFPTPFDSLGRYRESQVSALAMLEKINNNLTSLAVSVALFARRYKPAHPDPETSLNVTGFLPGMQCASYRGEYLIPLSQFCRDRKFVRNHLPVDRYAGRATYSKKRRRTILYDNEFTLAEKLCLTKERHLELSYGVALYGLEYTDHSRECPSLLSRAYGRTLLAKALVRFFESKPNIDEVFNNCTSIRPES